MPIESIANCRRAERVSFVGLILQVILFVGVLVLGLWTHAIAVLLEATHLLIGVLLWLILVVVYHQRKLVEQEADDFEELRRERERTGVRLFEGDEEQLLVSRRRLVWINRWVVGATTLVIAGLLAAGGSGWFGLQTWSIGKSVWSNDWPPVANTSMAMAVLVGAGFVAFLFSRYVSGMARQNQWQMLRAGATFLFGNCMMSVCLVAGMAFEQAGNAIPLRIAAHVVSGLMLVLAIECLLNFVLEVYRPRKQEEESRSAFESRFLGLFSEPGGIAASLAEAANYQFGFEVSTTWFYKLLQRAVVPLAAFGLASLLALSSIIIVEPGEQAIVERFGKPLQEIDKGAKALGPGVWFKRPWPFDRAYHYPMNQLQQIVLGVGPENLELNLGIAKDKNKPDIVLWTDREHGSSSEWNLLVATPPIGTGQVSAVPTTQPGDTETSSGASVPVSIIRAVMVVQYQITDLYKFAYTYANAEKLLEGIASRELIEYLVNVDIDRVMAADRGKAAEFLKGAIAKQADDAELGIEIVFLGFRGVHPPPEVAKEFEEVANSMSKKEIEILKAERDAGMMLIAIAGDRNLAERLYQAINDLEPQSADDATDENTLAAATKTLGGLLAQVGGDAAKILNTAKAKAYETVMLARSETESIDLEAASYQAAPDYYRRRRTLEVLSDAIKDKPKKVISFVPKDGIIIKIPGEEQDYFDTKSFRDTDTE